MPIPQSVYQSQMAEPTARAMRPVTRDRSVSGETITPEISLSVSAVLAAFTILTEDLSSLPLILYERRGRNKVRAYDSIYYRLMHDQPNPEHTSMIFRELAIGHLMGWGNFYGQLILDRRGDVAEIWPLRPDRMTVERKDGQRIYTYTQSDGKKRVFFSDELLHIPAFGFDGLVGYSRITLARNAIGLSISAEKFGGKFYENGANVGLVYKHPGALGEDAYKHLSESLTDRTGVEQSHKPIILEEGMSIDRLGIPPDDAQFLETRKFQVSEIARIFRVPPHMIGDVERSTSWGAGIDSQEQGYVNHTLRPWATRLEQSLRSGLLLPDMRETFYYEHLMDALLRGDIATRYESYVKAINNGIMTPNEVRGRENLNPYKDGDTFLRPLNMSPMNDGTSTGQAARHTLQALEPLWRDAAQRVCTRERNDVLGSVKRFSKKSDLEGLRVWLDSFYRNDHALFLKKQFGAVLKAIDALSGASAKDAFEVQAFGFLSARWQALHTLSFAEVEAVLENQDETFELLMDFFTEIEDQQADDQGAIYE